MAETTEPLVNIPQPKLPTRGPIGFKEMMGIQQPFLESKAKLMPQLSTAKEEELGAKQTQQDILSTGKAIAQQEETETTRGAMQQYRQKLEAEPLPAFVPTKDTAQDLAGLFSVVSVLGLIAGKGESQRALGAMNGMLEGYQKGRADLYKKEATEFDKNFKAMIQKHAEFRKEMEDAVKLAATDKQAGIAAAEMAATRAGSDIVKAMVKQGRIVDALTFVKEAEKGVDEGVKREATLRDKAQEQAAAYSRTKLTIEAADRRAEENRRAADEREADRARAKLISDVMKRNVGTPEKSTALKPPAKVVEGYIANTQLKTDVEDIAKDLRNPQLQQQIKQYRAEAFLTEEGKILNQMITGDIPSELRQFLTKIRDVRNNYYLNISGKAVTGGEALRNYGVVPQPGDSADVMMDKLRGMSKRIGDQVSATQQLFKLPNIQLAPGAPTSLNPNADYSIGGQGRYEVGQTYTDNKGNKAKYLGTNDSGQDIWDEE
jgi:hypothetical protein